MREFDYGFLSKELLPAKIVNITNAIYSLNTASNMRKDGNLKIFTELEAVAKVQSVKSSNAIEGIITSDDRIAEIVNGSSAPLNHSEAEIAGYRDALNIIHNNFESLDLTEETVINLHALMLSHTGDSDGGRYKKDNNFIIEISPEGYRRVRFKPIAAKEISQAMEQLILAYLSARDDGNVSPLLLIPCVVLDFLCIHPFRDGNGRMSRLLSLLLLYKSGFDVGKYVSFEEQINKQKDWYYEALRISSENWHENKNDYFPFVENFIAMLYACYKELDKRFAVINEKKVNKTARIEATVFNSLVPISKAEICKILPDVSPTTVEYVLGEMVRSGKLTKIGAGRGVKYLRNKGK